MIGQYFRYHLIEHQDFVNAGKSKVARALPLHEHVKYGFDFMILLKPFIRTARIVAGTLILLTLLAGILMPQVLPVSGNSFVNARLEWIRTPIEGRLEYSDIKVGDTVTRGSMLGTITNNRADDYFLNQLQTEKFSLESALFSLKSKRQQLAERSLLLQKRVADSLLELKEKTKIQLEVMQNDIALITAEQNTIAGRLVSFEKANNAYGHNSYAVVSRASIEDMQAKVKALEISIASKNSTVSLLNKKLDSAMNSTFVSEYTPLEQQQVMDIEQSLIGIDTEIASLELKSKGLISRINTRRNLLEMNTNYELVAGVSGILWDIGFSDGSYVSDGDSVVAIANAETIVVEGFFHQRYLDNISVGDPATVDLVGSDARLSGVVSEVRIRDQIKSADLSAFNLEAPSDNEFKVVVLLGDAETNTSRKNDPAAQSEEHQLYIGQRAKLIVGKSNSGFLPSVLLFFNR